MLYVERFNDCATHHKTNDACRRILLWWWQTNKNTHTPHQAKMQAPRARMFPILPLSQATKNAPGIATIWTNSVAIISSFVVNWTSLMPKLVAISMSGLDGHAHHKKGSEVARHGACR